MRIGFAGTPAFAATILRALHSSEHALVRVFTQPERPAGRGRRLMASPVAHYCDSVELPCFTPKRLRPEIDKFADLDMLVVAAYGLILPQSVLNAPRLGCINVHASLLPRWRGASPIEHAILNGDRETGVTIMRMTRGLDEGPVYQSATLPLNNASTLENTTAALADLGGREIVRFLDTVSRGALAEPTPQDESQATYAPRLNNLAERIDWRQSARAIERQIRAFYGRGMAYALCDSITPPLRLKILEAIAISGDGFPGTTVKSNAGYGIACGEGVLILKRVQLNRGKGKPLSIRDALNGYSDIFGPGLQFSLAQP